MAKTITKCSKCGVTLKRQMLLAMLINAGAHSSKNPFRCPEGGEHNFVIEEVCRNENKPS